MTKSTDRPDGSYSIHARRPTSTSRPESTVAAGKRKAKLGEASQLISAQARAPRAGESTKFRPIELPVAAPFEVAAEPRTLDLGPEPELELELLEPGAPVAQTQPASSSFTGGPTDRPLLRARPEGAHELSENRAQESAYERSARHADKQIAFKYVLPRQLEPWWRRKLGHIITAAILLAIGSYLYGCTKVMGDSVGFRRDMAGVYQELQSSSDGAYALTDTDVENAVRAIASRNDLDVDRVEIIAEEIGNSEPGINGCSPRYFPETIQFLDPVDKMNLLKLGRICKIPEYILTVRAHVEERWGLFHHAFQEVAYITVPRYQLTEIADIVDTVDAED